MALKKYSNTLDRLLKAAALANVGKSEKAAEALADALGQDDFEQTIEALDQQQQDMYDPAVDDQQFDEQDFARVLSRVTANKNTVIAGDESGDSGDDSAMEEDADAGFDKTGEDAEDVKVEHAGEDTDGSGDDDGEEEAAITDTVMQNVAARLNAREERAAANKKALLAPKAKAKK